MSRVIGIDAREDGAVLLQLRLVSRKIHLEHLVEESALALGGETAALRAVAERVGGVQGHGVDSLAVAVEGAKTILSTVSLPGSAERRFDELLPFELEAELPMEVDDVVFGYQLFARKRGGAEPVKALVVSAPKTLIAESIEHSVAHLGRQPEVIGSSALVLGLLTYASPSIRSAPRALILDVGLRKTDVCVVASGVTVAARSLSLGTSSFPAKAEQFVLQLKQTFAAIGGLNEGRIFLVGDGALLDGLPAFLSDRLGVPAEALSDFSVEGISEERRGVFARNARALALALQAGLNKGINLRQGEFAAQRGYGFLKEKLPLFLALAAAIVVSFLFATWAESVAVEKERAMLEASLGALTKVTFGKEITEPEEASTLLESARSAKPEDPMPYMDGFGAMVALSEAVPESIKQHDVEQLEVTKGKLKLRGQVDSSEDAQTVAKALEEHKCLENVTVTKTTQVVNSQRTRYHLEADIRCPEEAAPEKKKKPAEAASAGEEAAQ